MPGCKFIDAVDDDGFSRIADRAAIDGLIALSELHLDVLRRDCVVRIDRVDESRLGAALDGCVGHQSNVVQGVDQDARIDELIGKKRAVGVGEICFQLHRAGSRVDLVIDALQRAGRQELFLLAIKGRHCELLLPFHAGEDGGQVVFRQGEDERDRLHLSDHQQTSGVGGMDHITDIDQA